MNVLLEAVRNGHGDPDFLVGDTGTTFNKDARRLVQIGWHAFVLEAGLTRTVDAIAEAGLPLFPKPHDVMSLHQALDAFDE